MSDDYGILELIQRWGSICSLWAISTFYFLAKIIGKLWGSGFSARQVMAVINYLLFVMPGKCLGKDRQVAGQAWGMFG